GREDGGDREPVEERQVAAEDEEELKGEQERAGRVSEAARAEDEPGGDELAQVVQEDADLVEPAGQEVERATEGIRERLGLVVIVEAREVAPAGVAAQLDEPGPEHDAEDEPAEQPHDRRRHRTAGKGPRVEERAEEDGEKAGPEEPDTPAVLVPVPDEWS